MSEATGTPPIQRLDRGEPTACYRNWRSGPLPPGGALLLVDFELPQYWLQGSPPLALTALYCLDGSGLRLAVTDQDLTPDGLTPDGAAAVAQFDNWVQRHGLIAVTPGAPMELLPQRIPKPWGQEIWYSAVERRGVSRIGTASASVPLPWLQAVLPGDDAGGASRPLLLLKILDPLPQPVIGDLYFELHQTKQEVYVVTHIDVGAWPGGTGYVRFGFDANRLAACPDEQAFRTDYLAAVRAYEAVRRRIDALPAREQPGAELSEREQRLRREMDSFTHLRPLRVGDVVAVPPGLPHALQHGVRAVEFQTPVYERSILSHAQRVVTQDHWDTDSAVPQMLLTPPPAQPFTCLDREEGVRVERIVDFPDFEVRRIFLQGSSIYHPGPLPVYGIAMVLEGELCLCGTRFGAEQAVLLSDSWDNVLTPANPARGLVLLLALPRL